MLFLADEGGDGGAGVPGDLDGEVADAAGCAGDEDVACGEAGGAVEGVEGGEAGDGEGGGDFEADGVGQDGEVGAGDGDELGPGAGLEDADDAGAFLRSGAVGGGLLDDAGDVPAEERGLRASSGRGCTRRG